MRPGKGPVWIVCCLLFALAALHATAPRVEALDLLCDSSLKSCRSEIINRIRTEAVGIDVATWFFEDSSITRELIAKWQAGVPVRVLGDPDANVQHPLNQTLLNDLAAAGIPIRHKVSSGIEHWKMMLFSGQNVVYFGSANFSADAFVPYDPYRNFVDETIYLTNDNSVVDTFRTRFEDAWVNTTAWANYANAANGSVSRKYPIVTTPDPELNFAPASGSSSYRSRSVAAYNQETQQIDIIMYRITDQAHVDTLIKARQRGIPIRFYTEQAMYRDRSQLWHSMSVDKMHMAGIQIKDRAHAGLNHEKVVLLYGQQMTIFGSSNMTSKSSDSQHEHNYFTKKVGIFDWFEAQFNRKWNNTNPLGAPETKAFAPLPPDTPSSRSPADGAVGVATSGAKITWYGGPWAHKLRRLFRNHRQSPTDRGERLSGPQRDDESQSIVHAADARAWHDLLLEDRVEDDGAANAGRGGPPFYDCRGRDPNAVERHHRLMDGERVEQPNRRRLGGGFRYGRREQVDLEPEPRAGQDCAGAREPDELLRDDLQRHWRTRLPPLAAYARPAELAEQRFGSRPALRGHHVVGSRLRAHRHVVFRGGRAPGWRRRSLALELGLDR